MTLTLLIFGTMIALTAVFVVARPADGAGTAVMESLATALSDSAAETLAGSAGSAEPVPSDWHVAMVDTLRDAEDYLDALEAQGVEHRELVLLGNSCFAIRWR